MNRWKLELEEFGDDKKKEGCCGGCENCTCGKEENKEESHECKCKK
jgi:hypothetical protein